jgi:hypothetical protein
MLAWMIGGDDEGRHALARGPQVASPALSLPRRTTYRSAHTVNGGDDPSTDYHGTL